MKVPSLKELEEAAKELYFDTEFKDSEPLSDEKILECAQGVLPERTSMRVWAIVNNIRDDKDDESAVDLYYEFIDGSVRLDEIKAHLGSVDSWGKECVSATELVWWNIVNYLTMTLRIIRTKGGIEERLQAREAEFNEDHIAEGGDGE